MTGANIHPPALQPTAGAICTMHFSHEVASVNLKLEKAEKTLAQELPQQRLSRPRHLGGRRHLGRPRECASSAWDDA